jgi:hypothetical protein
VELQKKPKSQKKHFKNGIFAGGLKGINSAEQDSKKSKKSGGSPAPVRSPGGCTNKLL